MTEAKKTHRLTLQGVVQHTDGRTARVLIAESAVHPIYKKRYSVHKRVAADVPAGQTVAVGQKVTVQVMARRLSKNKVWQVKKAA